MAYSTKTCPRSHIPKFILDPNSYQILKVNDDFLGDIAVIFGFADLAAVKLFLGDTSVDIFYKMSFVNFGWCYLAAIRAPT